MTGGCAYPVGSIICREFLEQLRKHPGVDVVRAVCVTAGVHVLRNTLHTVT